MGHYLLMLKKKFLYIGRNQRGFLKTELNFGVLLYKFFSVELAYSINRIIMHLIAFVGFILLLKRYIFKDQNNLIPLIAFGFATLPFFFKWIFNNSWSTYFIILFFEYFL